MALVAATTPKKRGGSVRVRGTCTAGHITETTSAPGRVTWHGTCADDECDLSVYAKRVPKDIRPPEEPTAQTPPPDDEDEIREVSFSEPQPKRGPGEPQLPPKQPEQPAESSDIESVPAAGVPQSVPVVLDEHEQPRTEQPAGGRRRRGAELVERLRGERDHRPAARRFRHPLDPH